MTAGGTKGILDDLVTYKPQSPASTSKSNGVQAREKVLDAISPMRRGRPQASPAPSSRSTSPRKEPTKSKIPGNASVPGLSIEKDQAWKLAPKNNSFVRGHKSGLVTSGAWKVKPSASPDPASKGKVTTTLSPGFDSDFLTNGFGDSFGGSSLSLDFSNRKPKLAPTPILKPQLSDDLSILQEPPKTGVSRSYKAKDAFEGLGFAEKPPAPTLAEARTARTGLALPLEQSFTPRRLSPRPPSSPQLPSLPQPIPGNAPVEERFPSIEDLDRVTSSKPSYSIGSSQPSISKGTGGRLKPSTDASTILGSRSHTVTSTSIQDRKDGPLGEMASSQVSGRLQTTRPPLARGFTASSTTSYNNPKEATDSLANFLSRPSAAGTSPPSQDWLTGDDQENFDILSRFSTSLGPMPGVDGNPGEPVLRDSPSKRASFIEKSPHLIAQPLEGNVEQIVLPDTTLPSTPNPSASTAIHPVKSGNNRGGRLHEVNGDATVKGSGLSDNWSPVSPAMPKDRLPRKPSISSMSSDDGPEDPDGGFGTLRELRRSGQKRADVGSKPKRRQSSVHDLVDLWGGSSHMEKEKRNNPEPGASRSSFLPSGPDTPSGIAGLPRSSSPAGPFFLVSVTDKPSTSSRFVSPPVESERKLASTTVAPRTPIQTSRPSSSSNTRSKPRSRPQSMLIFPSKSAGEEPDLPSPSLAVPLDKEGIRTISRSRRTSITDIVQRYEGISGSGKRSPSLPGKPLLPFSVPPKPVDLKGHQNESQNIGSSHTRFIRVSPANSPVTRQGLSLNVMEDDKVYRPGSRISPTKTSPSRSPIEPGRSSSSRPQQMSVGDDDASEPKSPSPERSYAGVSRLIDQWQKKAEESNPVNARKPGGMNAKRFGVGVGGGR